MNSWESSACYPQRTFYPLSYGPSTRDHRITKTSFHFCSRCPSRSQAGFYLYALRPIANRSEPAFALLRYSFGGDRPSQTNRLAVFPARFHGIRGEMTNANRVVFHIVAPSRPEPRHQRLPPILRSSQPASLPGYSKGAWGLSVLPREGGIFTATSISPSLWLRQCSSRYAVHARRNLPDKELRYLRTVIVTAAVYRGFGRRLRSR